MAEHNRYEHPLVSRYATKEMSEIWSPDRKFSTWRQLWLALAKSEKELGLAITQEQLDAMSAHLTDIDYEYAAEMEKKFRHDVMAHVHTFGKEAPVAMPIIHLGATSCYVGDNADIIQIKQGLQLIQRKMVKAMKVLADFALEYKDMPAMGFTHFQPAQLVTVGKRASLWLQDLWLDFQQLSEQIDSLPMRGVKGTTGTQASFLDLFEGDHEKVKKLNELVAEKMGFKKVIPVSGQTYTRKIDYFVLSILSGIAQSAYKMAGDIRLLANMKEIEEPFEKNQIGSSAMAYKRNPMRSERICSLARYVISLTDNAAQTHAAQWFERTLDDSANRRMVLPEAFLATDVILNLITNVSDGLQVWPNVIKAHIKAELPFMATENILMACVKAGGDRQELHEAIRTHSMEAGKRVKVEGAANDLLERIAADPLFKAVHDHMDTLLDPSLFIGRCPQQVEEFISEEVAPILKEHAKLLEVDNVDDINV
ncbi:Adenylosuccinate lyase [Phytophthora cactorum]|nr:Adenylosuccinate lyase [Phytophthora cactorum]